MDWNVLGFSLMMLFTSGEVVIGIYIICFHDRWVAASRRRRRLSR